MLEAAAAAAVKRARQTTSMYGASGLDQKGLLHLLLLFAHFMLNISMDFLIVLLFYSIIIRVIQYSYDYDIV